MDTMPHHALAQRDWERVDDRVQRKVVHGERMTVTLYDFAADGAFAEHTHEQEQITFVLRGSVRFTIEGAAYDVRAGEVIVIPPGKVHDAVATEAAAVYSAVSPSRRDADGIRMVAEGP